MYCGTYGWVARQIAVMNGEACSVLHWAIGESRSLRCKVKHDPLLEMEFAQEVMSVERDSSMPVQFILCDIKF